MPHSIERATIDDLDAAPPGSTYSRGLNVFRKMDEKWVWGWSISSVGRYTGTAVWNAYPHGVLALMRPPIYDAIMAATGG